MSELISVIVPVYNVEKYLCRCIDSIVKQTYTTLEIILIDDGSTDHCDTICDQYMHSDSRITAIHKSNGGLSTARNAGIDIAHGSFITFIDSDDWVESTYIEKLYGILLSTSSDISICNFYKTSDENTIILNENPLIYEFTSSEASHRLVSTYTAVQMVVAWGKLYKIDLFNNIRYPADRLHEDEFITYKLIHLSEKIAYTAEKLYCYFQRPDSITGGGQTLQLILDIHAAWTERALFYETFGMEDLKNDTYKQLFYFFSYLKTSSLPKASIANINELYHKLYHTIRTIRYPISFQLYVQIIFHVPPAVRRILNSVYSKLIQTLVRLKLH